MEKLLSKDVKFESKEKVLNAVNDIARPLGFLVTTITSNTNNLYAGCVHNGKPRSHKKQGEPNKPKERLIKSKKVECNWNLKARFIKDPDSEEENDNFIVVEPNEPKKDKKIKSKKKIAKGNWQVIMVDDINKHTCGLDKNESFYHQNRKINISQYEKIVSMTQNNKTPKQILEELKDPITKEAPVTAKDIYNIRYKLSKLSENETPDKSNS